MIITLVTVALLGGSLLHPKMIALSPESVLMSYKKSLLSPSQLPVGVGDIGLTSVHWLGLRAFGCPPTEDVSSAVCTLNPKSRMSCGLRVYDLRLRALEPLNQHHTYTARVPSNHHAPK